MAERPKIDEIVDRMIKLDGYSKESITDFFRSADPIDEAIALEYLRRLPLTRDSIVDAYRSMCASIFVCGDSQIVDRIHERFSTVFAERNSYGYDQTQCHTIVTAFVLLNSDLHSKNISNKMSQDDFIKNIRMGYPKLNFDNDVLISIFQSVKKAEIKHTSIMRKRSNKNPPTEVVESKKLKTDTNENIKNFGFHLVKMRKKSTLEKLQNKPWKTYFSSINNLKISFYDEHKFHEYNAEQLKNHPSTSEAVDYSEQLKNHSSTSEAVDYQNICVNFIKIHPPVEELSIHHAYAVLSKENNLKCHLFLIDNSEYFFKLINPIQTENWVHSVNYASSLLSCPPMPGTHCNLDIRTIVKHKWTKDISKLSLEQQRERTKKQMTHFEDDLVYLFDKKKKISDYKSKVKFVERHLERYKIYNRTLEMAEPSYPISISAEQNFQIFYEDVTQRTEGSSNSVSIESSSRNFFSRIFDDSVFNEKQDDNTRIK